MERPGKIVCVGRNYREHAKELGNEVTAEPLLFFKPPSCVIANGAPIELPADAGRVDFEDEVAVVIGAKLTNASERRGTSSGDDGRPRVPHPDAPVVHFAIYYAVSERSGADRDAGRRWAARSKRCRGGGDRGAFAGAQPRGGALVRVLPQ